MSQQPPPFPMDPSRPTQPLPQGFQCPKCRGTMRTYDRNGVHIEQCDSCRGIFLDFGEFEHLSQLETRFVQQPPPATYGPGWGQRGGHQYRKKGLSGLFFSS